MKSRIDCGLPGIAGARAAGGGRLSPGGMLSAEGWMLSMACCRSGAFTTASGTEAGESGGR